MNLHPDIERVANLGWHLYPVRRKSKAGCFKGASAAATCDLDVLALWQDEYDPNWRVVFGPSAIWGIDIDVPSPDHAEDGVAAFTDLVAGRPVPRRPMTRSGGGGLCLFFSHRMENISGKTGYPCPGIDPRRGALSVTIPPSTHHRTGKEYTWIVPPWEVAPPRAPAWLIDIFAPPPEDHVHSPRALTCGQWAMQRLQKSVSSIRCAPSGRANDTLNAASYSVARDVGAGVIDFQEAVEHLYAAARDRNIPFREAMATIRSAMTSGRASPRKRA